MRNKLLALLLTAAMMLTLCVTVASADTAVTLSVKPNITEFDQKSGEIKVVYTVTATAPANSHIGAIQFTLTAPDGASLADKAAEPFAQDSENGYWVNPGLHYVDDNTTPDGIFGSEMGYTPASGVFSAAGTTEDRNLVGPTVLMTIPMTIKDTTQLKNYKLGVSELAASTYDAEKDANNLTVNVTDNEEVKAQETFTVTLHANNNVTPAESETVPYVRGDYTLPTTKPDSFTAPTSTDPEKPHVRFVGWSTAPHGEKIDGSTYTVTKDTDLYALWEATAGVTMTLVDKTKGNATVKVDQTPVTTTAVVSPGEAVTVTCDSACVVAYSLDNGAIYTKLSAVATAVANTYSFTIPNTVTTDFTLGVILRGDATGDGTTDVSDAQFINRANVNLETYSALAALAADANIDGTADVSDAQFVNRANVGLETYQWTK